MDAWKAKCNTFGNTVHPPLCHVPINKGTLVIATPESILEDFIRFRIDGTKRELWLDVEDFARDFVRA
jgi:hypothetical protein